MAIYSLAVRTTGTASASAAWEIRTTTTDRAYILEIGFFLSAATASTYGLGRPAAIGVTPTTPVTVLAEDPGDPVGTITSALAWATGPTAPANFFRRISLPATIGAGVIWTFPKGLKVTTSSSVVLWNLALNGAVDAYVVLDE